MKKEIVVGNYSIVITLRGGFIVITQDAVQKEPISAEQLKLREKQEKILFAT